MVPIPTSRTVMGILPFTMPKCREMPKFWNYFRWTTYWTSPSFNPTFIGKTLRPIESSLLKNSKHSWTDRCNDTSWNVYNCWVFHECQTLAEPMIGLPWVGCRNNPIKRRQHWWEALLLRKLEISTIGCFWVEGSSTLHYYDKRTPFTLAGWRQDLHLQEQKIIGGLQGWRIMPWFVTTYVFPFIAKHRWLRSLLYVANWPEKRTMAWDVLLKPAIENMAYCVGGVNRIGTDGNGHDYVGHSAVYGVLGGKLTHENFDGNLRRPLRFQNPVCWNSVLNFSFWMIGMVLL